MSGLGRNDVFVISQVLIFELDLLRHLSVQTFTEAFSAKNSLEHMTAYVAQSFAAEQLLREFNHPDSIFYFARIEDQIVGYLKLNVLDGQTEMKDQDGMEIERIYILSSYQGNGIGSNLMHFAIEQAKKQGKSFIWLGVWEENIDALRFYSRYGFEEFGKHQFMLGSDLQNDLLLKLNL